MKPSDCACFSFENENGCEGKTGSARLLSPLPGLAVNCDKTQSDMHHAVPRVRLTMRLRGVLLSWTLDTGTQSHRNLCKSMRVVPRAD